MDDRTFTLAELAEATGIEARTIRSYIERGLIPGAESRGRGATYTADHLNRLKFILALRRARPNVSLSDIRIQLQKVTPEQLTAHAGGGMITAAVLGDLTDQDDDPDAPRTGSLLEPGVADLDPEPRTDRTVALTRPPSPTQLTGAERLVQALQKLSCYAAPAPVSKTETWHRIAVTEDIELSVRAGIGVDQLAMFRELADILRHLLNRTDVFTHAGEE
jgi:DNA-binding transcriptional MerR regulator